jgi:hypothetical protein
VPQKACVEVFEGFLDKGSAMFFLLPPRDALLTSDKSQPLQATGTRVGHVFCNPDIKDSLGRDDDSGRLGWTGAGFSSRSFHPSVIRALGTLFLEKRHI